MYRILFILGAFFWFYAPSSFAAKWRMMEGCTFVPNESNDGDSFHVKYKRRQYIFRLYFADTPETDRSFPDRVAEQAKYWGISEKASLGLGREAARFTRKFLENGFTVYTQMEDARGRSDKERYYAMVLVGEKNLSEELVRNGLARIFGQDTDLPDGTRSTTFWWRLKTAEREARRNRLGAFSPNVEAASAKDTTGQTSQTIPIIAERDILLAYTIPVFSMKDSSQQIGMLQRGAQVHVVGASPFGMVCVRFTGADGQLCEAQCRRVDLGL